MQDYLDAPNDKASLKIKRQVLEIAIILFSKKGYYNTTFSEISKIADIDIESIYTVYDDKKELFIECFEIYIKKLKKELDLNSLFDLTSREKFVSTLIDNYFKAYKVMPEFQKQITATSMTNNDFKKLVMIFEFEIQEHLSRILKAWSKDLKTKNIYVTAFFIHNILETTMMKAIFNEMKTLENGLKKELENLIFKYLFLE